MLVSLNENIARAPLRHASLVISHAVWQVVGEWRVQGNYKSSLREPNKHRSGFPPVQKEQKSLSAWKAPRYDMAPADLP